MADRSLAFVRRVIGFVVGFGTALVIIVATDMSRNADTAATRVLGDVDVFEYCRTGEFELEAALLDEHADGWRCVGRRNGIWGFDEVDFDDACRRQHDARATAVTSDPSSPYAWQCVVDG